MYQQARFMPQSIHRKEVLVISGKSKQNLPGGPAIAPGTIIAKEPGGHIHSVIHREHRIAMLRQYDETDCTCEAAVTLMTVLHARKLNEVYGTQTGRGYKLIHQTLVTSPIPVLDSQNDVVTCAKRRSSCYVENSLSC